MGGTLFAAKGLHTPRMPTATYTSLLAHVLSLLSQHFSTIEVPPEAPGKQSHGDIDIDILLPSSDQTLDERITAATAVILGALSPSATSRRSPTGISLALPYPPSLASDTAPSDPSTTLSNPGADPHVQIDITLHANAVSLAWLNFNHGYGDTCQILGVLLRPLRLMFQPTGLYARDPELARQGRHDGTVFLSISVPDVLTFLGLDVGRYFAGFATEDALFRWIAQGKYFDRAVFERKLSSGEDAPPNPADPGADTGDYERTPVRTTALQRANDRQRARKRPMYARFLFQWLPEHPELGVRDAVSGGEVMREALKFFGKEEEHVERVKVVRAARRERMFWEKAKDAVRSQGVSNDHANLTVRGFKRWLEVGADGARRRGSVELDGDAQGAWTATGLSEDALLEIVRDRHEEVYALERERVKAEEALRAASKGKKVYNRARE